MRMNGPDLSTIESCMIGAVSSVKAVTEITTIPFASAAPHPLAIASCPNSSPCVLEGLAKVCSAKVAEHIAINPSAPATVLATLSTHPEADVRVAVAENRKTPLETIWTLAHDEDVDVRFQMAENHHLPTQILKHLSEDENPYVSCRAQKTLARVQNTIEVGASDWRAFRRAELKRRISEVNSLGDGTPMYVINKLFNSISRYARAI